MGPQTARIRWTSPSQADNDAPTAEAGTNQTVDEGDTVSLSGSGSDPESQNLTYSWAQTAGSPNVTLTGATTQTPSFTAPELLANATLTFTLTVNDGTSNGTDTVEITITADNDAPSANAGTDQTVDEGAEVSLSGSGSDPESQNLTYSWAQTAGSPNVTLTGATTQTPSFTAPELLANATLTFTLTVNDGTSNGTDTVDITIVADNDAPSANAGTNQTVDEGAEVSLSGSGSDPESQNLTYSWSSDGGQPERDVDRRDDADALVYRAGVARQRDADVHPDSQRWDLKRHGYGGHHHPRR